MLNDTVTEHNLIEIIIMLMRKLKAVLMGLLAGPYDTCLALVHPAFNKNLMKHSSDNE